MNRKGFTLIELLATITVLGLIMSIGGITITNIIKSANEKNYKILISNIKDSVELYYQECSSAGGCNQIFSSCDNRQNTVSLEYLVENGFIATDVKDKSGSRILINPKDNKNMNGCCVTYSYNTTDKKLTISHYKKTYSSLYSCPSAEDYND